LLVRHGRVAWNARSAYAGWTDLELDSRGVLEARLLSDRLQDAPLAAVYSSDLTRARVTGEIIAGPHGLAVNTVSDIREVNYGQWEGLAEADIRSQFGDRFFESWQADPENVLIPGGETFGEMRDRAQPAVERIAAVHPGQTAVVVAHKSVIRVLICSWLGLDLGMYKQIGQRNAAINSVLFQGNRVAVETVNDVCHLVG
jgi:broad specificity phosphatase PhoE